MNWRKALGIFCVAILPWRGAFAAEGPVLSRGSLEVRFDEETRTFVISDREAGNILAGGVVRARLDNREIASDREGQEYRANVDEARGELAVDFGGGLRVRIAVRDDENLDVRVESETRGSAVWDSYAFANVIQLVVTDGTNTGSALVPTERASGYDPLIAALEADREKDNGVLITTLGRAEVPGARSLFDPENDLAITAGPVGRARWKAADKAWQLHSEAPVGETLLSLKIQRHYYRDTLGIAQYAPIKKRPKWPTAPVVAMTWYGIKGWEGNPAQTKEWLYPNIDWVAKHLLPYAETLVFQLDDNYYTDNDPYMRDIADYIRSKGLVPGIWFTPFTVAPKEVHDEHPDWFLHDEDGEPLGSFGGVSYRDHYTLNVTKPGAVENWYGMWWRKASETWNFDFFKIDGQPQVIDRYKKSVDGGGVEGYRRGLKIARDIVGPAKFINGCWGIPLEAIGLVDGSRTGGDTGNHPHATDIVLRWNFLNNVCWWSDPDAAANLYKATVERTRLNAQARVLTGQQFLTDDVWTSVPPEIARVWQLSYPMLNIKPVNLYKIEGDWKKYDLFDLRIAKPWGTYDVVGLFNYDGVATEKALDLSRLPLEASEVHVFEYWDSLYLGKFARDAKIPVYLKAYEGKVYSIVPADDARPQLISTSRHVTQGGLDLDRLDWRREGAAWVASGRSSHLVAGDPYELVFAVEEGGSVSPGAGIDSLRLGGGGVVRATIRPAQSGAVDWELRLGPTRGTALEVFPSAVDMTPESRREITVLNRGMEGFRWRAHPSDPRIRLTADRGELQAAPSRATIALTADTAGLQPGETWTGRVVFEKEGEELGGQAVEVRLHVPPPENLALRAKASASSRWNLNYKAERANDGVRETRWNARQGDKDGCWLQLKWEEMVEFDRVVIDECMDFGPRIQAWRLMAGRADKGVDLARGEGVGRMHTVDLRRPMKAEWLRLVIEKASVVPTIWELEVYRMKKEQ